MQRADPVIDVETYWLSMRWYQRGIFMQTTLNCRRRATMKEWKNAINRLVLASCVNSRFSTMSLNLDIARSKLSWAQSVLAGP